MGARAKQGIVAGDVGLALRAVDDQELARHRELLGRGEDRASEAHHPRLGDSCDEALGRRLEAGAGSAQVSASGRARQGR